jgi:hypothetical protein
MKIHRPALRHALRGWTPWLFVAFALFEGSVTALLGWQTQPVGTIATVLGAAFAGLFFRFRYTEIVDGERRAAERAEYEARLKEQTAATHKLLEDLTAGGCPANCAGCSAERAEHDRVFAEWRHERAVRHGHANA